ncbi:MAG: V-type ATP synthase subunit E [Candidatus Binatia bacterium]
MTSLTAVGAAGAEVAMLLRLIREQAAAEIADMRARAHERAARLRATADAEAEAIRAGARSAGESRGNLRAATLLAVVETQSHLELLSAREALIERVIARARALLARFPTIPQATERLTNLIREGLQALPPGPVRVRTPREYEPLLDEAIRSSLNTDHRAVAFATDPELAGGVVVEVDDGRLRFDNSFDGRIRRRMYRLRRLAADMLLGEEGTHSGGP